MSDTIKIWIARDGVQEDDGNNGALWYYTEQPYYNGVYWYLSAGNEYEVARDFHTDIANGECCEAEITLKQKV